MDRSGPRPHFAALSLLLAGVACLSWGAAMQADGNYSVEWSSVDGGGGTSTGGAYAVSGSIGQAEASVSMSGGNFTLAGGFWSLPVAVQTPGAPALVITNAGPGFAVISWTPPTPGFALELSPTLEPAAWTKAPSGATNPVIVPATFPLQYYRLSKP